MLLPRLNFPSGPSVVNIMLTGTLNMVRPEKQSRRKPLSAQPETVPPLATTADLRELYQRHSRMILRTAWRITGKAEDAEDVLQQIFLRLLRTNPPESAGEISGGYLRRAAVNTALDILRKRRNRPEEPATGDSPASARLLSRDNPEDAMRSRDLAEALLHAVSQLNNRAAEVFILRDIEGLDNQEIAALLGTTPNTVTVTYHRARTRLLEKIASWEGRAGAAR